MGLAVKFLSVQVFEKSWLKGTKIKKVMIFVCWEILAPILTKMVVLENTEVFLMCVSLPALAH